MQQRPSIGRTVHYVLPLGAAGGARVGEVRPLIITAVHPLDRVNGKVILDGLNDRGHDDHAYTASYAEPEEGKQPVPGTWHWPPRV